MLGPARKRQLAALSGVVVALAGGGCSELSADGMDGAQADGARVAARVTRHTDGDTLWLSGIGKVRLIGIDTPEVYGEDECYGHRASVFVDRTVPIGAEVRYRLGVDERDRYGRALAYLWLRDGRFLNHLLVARGFAQPLTIPPNDEYSDEFVRASGRARETGRGLWGVPGCAG